MIKVFCDICSKEINDNDFMCEMKMVEVGINLTTNQKAPKQSNFNICKECYNNKLKNILNGKKTIKI